MAGGIVVTGTTPPTPKRVQWFLATVVMVVYATLPFRIGDRYPLCRFSMFSDFTTSDGRLIARVIGPDGRTSDDDITDFDQWHCDAATMSLDPPPGAVCPAVREIPTNYMRHGYDHVRFNLVDKPQKERVQVIRQRISFPETLGPARYDDCALFECTAHRSTNVKHRGAGTGGAGSHEQ